MKTELAKPAGTLCSVSSSDGCQDFSWPAHGSQPSPNFCHHYSGIMPNLFPNYYVQINASIMCKILAENSDQFEVIIFLTFSTNRYKSPTNPQNIIVLVIAHNIF